MHVPKGRKLSEKSLNILKALYDLGEVVIEDLSKYNVDYFPVSAYRVHYRQTLNLKRSGYVAAKKRKIKNNKSFFHLTPKGRLGVLKYLHLEKLLTVKWDGNWRVVIFDVPEDDKKKRERLRTELKYLGFQQLQKSVYITPYPVTKELEQILEEWGIREDFRFLTVTEIDGNKELMKSFDLN